MNSNDSNTALNDASTLTALVPMWDAGEETLVFPASGKFVCGSGTDSAARIQFPGVEERHCRLICRTSEVKVEPFGSNSVLVNGHPVFGSKTLASDDIVSVGPAEFRVERRRESRMCRVNVMTGAGTSIRSAVAAAKPDPAVKSLTDDITNRFARPVDADAGSRVTSLEKQPQQPVGDDEAAISSSINSQIENIESQLSDAMSVPAVPSNHGIAAASQASLMPVLSRATQENRRRLLDAREAQLTEWYSNLEVRRAELDIRSTTLARLQAQLTERQDRKSVV